MNILHSCIIYFRCVGCQLSLIRVNVVYYSSWPGNRSSLDVQEIPTLPQDEEVDGQQSDIETIGPTTQEFPEPLVPEAPGRPGGSGITYSLGFIIFFFN